MKREKLIEQGYKPVKKSITFFQANFVGILPILPLVLIYIIGYACFYYFVRDKSIGAASNVDKAINNSKCPNGV
ncbi:MAG TPA: hypothetical protein PKV44_06395, partial [Bacillota bacterium]|nr:hypothetical protein [Bacillota bacterium]